MGELKDADMKQIEQIRLAGSVLLELSQNQDGDVKEEAGIQLTRLVDVLSRLNSKATDELVFKGFPR